MDKLKNNDIEGMKKKNLFKEIKWHQFHFVGYYWSSEQRKEECDRRTWTSETRLLRT